MDIFKELYSVITDRKANPVEGSYTNYLFDKGTDKISKKLGEGAEKIYQELSEVYNCEYDDRGAIGKRYRRQDEIGTPFCITYDFDSETDGCVTVRDRDSMAQERVAIADLKQYFADRFSF